MLTITGSAVELDYDYGFCSKRDYLAVNCCGYQRFLTRDMTIFRPSGRCDYQMIYVLNGKSHLRLEKNPVTLGRGNLILFRPGERQHYSYSHIDGTETYWVHFTGYGAEDFLKALELYDKPYIQAGFSPDYAGLFNKIIRELQLNEVGSGFYAASCLEELLVLFARACKNERNLIPDREISEIITEMNLSYHKNLPISYYASKCNLSVYRFIHKFRQIMGIPPHEYLTDIRLKMARQLLNTSLNVADVTDIIGYSDPLYFSRIFKKRFGVSPSEFKRSALNHSENGKS